MSDELFMRECLLLAHEAAVIGEVPVGAAVVHNGRIIASAYNRTVTDQDPTAHAEHLAIRDASKALGRWRLDDCTLYVTLEPCAQCAGTIVLARIKRVVFGAWDDKAGMAGSIYDILRNPKLNHSPEVLAGVLKEECGEILKAFFERKRVGKNS